MTDTDAYLSEVRVAMAGMEPAVRKDILKELRSHLAEAAAANGGDVAKAIASMGPAAEVGREYRRVYGYGRAFRVLFVAAAGFAAFASSPFLGVGPDGALPNPASLPALLVLVVWLLWASVAAGSRVGLYAGIVALLVRTLAAGALALAYPGASLELLGGVTFVLSNVLLVLLGWLPGTARRAWTRKGAEL